MLIPRSIDHDPAELRGALTGRVAVPGEPGWDEARQAWNLAVDQHPALVVVPESIADVQVAVSYARVHGIRIAVQGTGHNAGAIASLEGAMLVKTSALRGVKIDAANRRAYVRAGDLWADVTAPASEHGLAPLAGSSPDVGVIGYTLGGGLSWLSRTHGLACNSVTAIAVVLSDGRLVRCDAEHEPGLFWALRGGGGSHGIVVGMQFELYRVEDLTAGWLVFDSARAAEVVGAWRRWVETVPDEMTSCARVIDIPPFPDIPEPVRGRSLAIIETIMLGDVAASDALLAPLRALGPEMDTVGPIAPAALSHLHMDPDHPAPAECDHAMLAELPQEGIDALLSQLAPGTRSPVMGMEIRHLGGALATAPAGHGALGRLDGEYLVFALGMVVDPAVKPAIREQLTRMMHAVGDYDSGRTYTNFVERPTPSAAAFDELTYARLKSVKAAYDPDGMFNVSRAII